MTKSVLFFRFVSTTLHCSCKTAEQLLLNGQVCIVRGCNLVITSAKEAASHLLVLSVSQQNILKTTLQKVFDGWEQIIFNADIGHILNKKQKTLNHEAHQYVQVSVCGFLSVRQIDNYRPAKFFIGTFGQVFTNVGTFFNICRSRENILFFRLVIPFFYICLKNSQKHGLI